MDEGEGAAVTGRTSSPWRRLARVRVAAEDVGWLIVLVPVGFAFGLLLVLARGYYACRRRGMVFSALYTGAVVGVLGWVIVRLFMKNV